MAKRPAHLTAENASRFKDQGLVDVYHHRLPYPQAVFDMLLDWIQDDARVVLDVGTGIGNIARQLAPHVHHVDAIDFSQAMIERGKTMPNGNLPNLHWIWGQVEDSIPDRQYSLIVGGDCMHWMDWDVIFSKFAEHLLPSGGVALVGRIDKQTEWFDNVTQLIKQYSLYQNFERYNLIQLIQDRGYFQLLSDEYSSYYDYQQSVDDYIASWHSRGSLSPDTMPTDHVQAFDDRLREIVEPYATDGMLSLSTRGRVTYGKPMP